MADVLRQLLIISGYETPPTPYNAEIKTEWSYTFTSPHVLIACKRNNLPLTLSTTICVASILLSASSVAFWFSD